MIPSENLEASRLREEKSLARYEAELPALITRSDLSPVGAVVDAYCRISMYLAMVDIRVRLNDSRGWGRLQKAVEISRYMDKGLEAAANADVAGRVVRHGGNGFIWPRGDLLYPIAVCAFMGTFERANDLARIERHPYFGGDSRPEGCFAAVLSAAVLTDHERLMRSKRDLENDWAEYDLYVEGAELLEAVTGGDQMRFNELMANAEKRYARRAKKEKYLSDYPEVWGGDDYNDVQLDFMSILSCKLALRRGMSVSHDTPSAPQRIIRYGLEPSSCA